MGILEALEGSAAPLLGGALLIGTVIWAVHDYRDWVSCGGHLTFIKSLN